jgi:RNA polymerase sigma-70 factor (ECF subfamily)
MPLVYDELRQRARALMSRERPGHTLQATALVNEAYMRLVDQTRVSWRGRTHFLAVGAMVMRRILVDHARGQRRDRRGGSQRRVTLSEAFAGPDDRGLGPEELLSLESALEELAALDSRQASVVELRAFGGLTVPEVARNLGVSPTTVEGDWRHARAWLRRRLSGGDERHG